MKTVAVLITSKAPKKCVFESGRKPLTANWANPVT